MMNNINIGNQPILDVVNEKITYNLVGDSISRYFVKRYDGKFTELSKTKYEQYKDNPFFEKVIIKWYIRGTQDFVRQNNQKELARAERRLTGIQNLIVNPLQLYQGVQ